MNQEALRQHRKYTEVRARIWPENRPVNVAVETRLAVEKYRREALQKWEADAAKAISNERARRLIHGSFSTQGVAQVQPFVLSEAGTYEAGDISGIIVYNPKKTMSRIAKKILRKYPNITMADIRGDVRTKMMVKARRHVIAAIKALRPDLSYTAIGKFVNKDHTTCIYAVERFAEEQLGAT